MPDCICLRSLLSAFLVSRLLLSLFIAHDALIGPMRRPGYRLGHAALAAMFATLILGTFHVVCFWHSDRTLLSFPRGLSFPAVFSQPVNVIAAPRVPFVDRLKPNDSIGPLALLAPERR